MKIRDVPQSGRIGDMVSYKTRFGQFRRRFVVPRDPRTAVQVTRRMAFVRVPALWKTLTEAQRAMWAATAVGSHTRARLGQSGTLSGYLLFVRINCNLAKVGLPPVKEPPSFPSFNRNPVNQLLITNTAAVIALQLSVSGQLAPYTLVLGAKPQSAGAVYVDHFTFLGLLPPPENGLSVITPLYTARFGLPRIGTQVFLHIQQHIDGWEDLPKQVRAIVPVA